ncbi:DUF982 domain-containing protein, partial [Rhizobium ruizarguesonis]
MTSIRDMIKQLDEPVYVQVDMRSPQIIQDPFHVGVCRADDCWPRDRSVRKLAEEALYRARAG